MWRLVLFLIIFLSASLCIYAQNVAKARVDGLYMDPLDKVLDQLTKETGVQFDFNREKLALIHYEARNFSLPLTEFLNQICKQNRLKYYVDEKGVVIIFDMFEDPRETSVLGRGVAAKTYTGKPEKFNFALTGKTIDKQSGESLPFVNITIKGTTLGAASNVDGFFNIQRVPTDTSTLIVSYMGYETRYVYLTPQSPTSSITIELAQAATQLQNITVTGQKEQAAPLQSNEKISMVKMTPAKIATLPNIGERDIFRSFQLMPGVSAANENAAGLYVRGGTPDQALVLYDGFTVYHVDHLFGFYSAFNYNALKDVQLYKGGYEAKFGGRMASVVEITGKEGNQRAFNIGGDLSLLSGNLFTEIPINKKLTILAAGRKSYRGPLYDKIFNSFNQTNNSNVPQRPGPGGGRFNRPDFSQTVKSFFYDLNSKVTYRPNDRDIFSWSVYNGTDKMDNSRDMSGRGFGSGQGFNSSITDLTRWGNTGTSVKWSRRWTDNFYGNTLVSYSNYFNHRDRSNSSVVTNDDGETTVKTGTLEDNSLNDISIKSDYEWKRSATRTIEFGTQITYNDIKYTYSQDDTSTVIDKHDRGLTTTVYAQQKFRMGNNKFLIVPGVRANHYSITGKPYIEPRLSFNYQLSTRISIKGATGRYYQFTRRVMREDLLQGSRDFWTMSDGDKLPVSYADHFILGASYENEDILFDVEAYIKNLYGLSEYSLRFTPAFGTVKYSESFYTGTGQTHGIDFLLQKKAGHFSGWIGYTLAQTVNTYPIYQETPFLASQNVKHEFKSINVYKRGNWDLSLTWIFASGKPYTAPTGAYTVDLLDGTSNRFYSVTAKNGVRLPNYHRMDAAITYHWPNKNGAMNSIGVSFFNLYNRQNVWYREFQVQYGELVQTDVHYMGFTPNVTASMKLR
jgi:ferric enterobactin receptor